MDSRLTFREKCPDVCWQKQLRDKHNYEGMPVGAVLDLKKAQVRPVSRRVAEQIIKKYEWLGTMGAGTQRHYGVFFGAFCAGVTTFASSGAIPAMPKMFRLTSSEVSYLARGACVHWAPNGTNSRLIARSCIEEKKHGIKIIVAFSDSDAGEIGTVYQASNWFYIGKSDSGWFQWVSPKGKIWSSNSLTKRRSQFGVKCKDIEEELLKAGWKKQISNPKGRYIFLVDNKDQRLKKLLENIKQPYPKRAKQAIASFPDDSGGAAPTGTLQNEGIGP